MCVHFFQRANQVVIMQTRGCSRVVQHENVTLPTMHELRSQAGKMLIKLMSNKKLENKAVTHTGIKTEENGSSSPRKC